MCYNTFMGMIKIYASKSKPAKKKPGWQKAEQEYKEWQSKIAGMSSGIKGLRQQSTIGKAPPKELAAGKADILQAKYVVGSGTKKVSRPEIEYKGNPELIERERIARERKFNSAPMYNKGGAAFVSEEELQNVLSSNKRR